MNDSMAEVLRLRDESWIQYKAIKKQATSLRGKFLDELVAARAEAGWDSAAKGTLVIKTRECQRHRARLLKALLNPSQSINQSINSTISSYYTTAYRLLTSLRNERNLVLTGKATIVPLYLSNWIINARIRSLCFIRLVPL